MFLTSLHHLQCLFPTCSIVNALFKSTLKLLFFKKIQNKKNKKNKKPSFLLQQEKTSY